MKRLEQSLNKPTVVLLVGVVAVALNVLLYFGYFLPRTTPLVEQIYSIGTSLPEAIGGSDSETGNSSGTNAGSKSEAIGGSDSETGSKSDPGAGGTSGPEANGESGSDSSSTSAQDSPSGSPAVTQPQQQSSGISQSPDDPPPPELPPLPTPAQDQY